MLRIVRLKRKNYKNVLEIADHLLGILHIVIPMNLEDQGTLNYNNRLGRMAQILQLRQAKR